MNFERHIDPKKILNIGLGKVMEIENMGVKVCVADNKIIKHRKLSPELIHALLKILSTPFVPGGDSYIHLTQLSPKKVPFSITNIKHIKFYERGKRRFHSHKWHYQDIHLPTWDIASKFRNILKIAFEGKIYETYLGPLRYEF